MVPRKIALNCESRKVATRYLSFSSKSNRFSNSGILTTVSSVFRNFCCMTICGCTSEMQERPELVIMVIAIVCSCKQTEYSHPVAPTRTATRQVVVCAYKMHRTSYKYLVLQPRALPNIRYSAKSPFVASLIKIPDSCLHSDHHRHTFSYCNFDFGHILKDAY